MNHYPYHPYYPQVPVAPQGYYPQHVAAAPLPQGAAAQGAPVLVQTPYGAAYYTMAPPAAPAAAANGLFNITGDRFVKGMLIGAAATYLVTNENVQKSAIKSAVKLWSVVQGGVEEMKERFHDAEAEIQAGGD